MSTLPTIWDSLEAAGPERALLLLRRPVHRALGWPLTPTSASRTPTSSPRAAAAACPEVSFVDPRFVDHGERPAVRRPPARRHPSRPALPQRGLPGRHEQPELGHHRLRDHLRRVGRLLRSRRPEGGARRRSDATVCAASGSRRSSSARSPGGTPSPDARYDHTSILKMIEWRWGLPALTPATPPPATWPRRSTSRAHPDLTAPQWDVPDPDALSAHDAVVAGVDPAARSEPKPRSTPTTGAASVRWPRQYGFADLTRLTPNSQVRSQRRVSAGAEAAVMNDAAPTENWSRSRARPRRQRSPLPPPCLAPDRRRRARAGGRRLPATRSARRRLTSHRGRRRSTSSTHRFDARRRAPRRTSSCSTIPEETAGPYPGDGSNGVNVLTQDGIVRSDIRSSFGSSSTRRRGRAAHHRATGRRHRQRLPAA